MQNNRFKGPYRQSLLKSYSQCPRKFRLLEIDKVPVEMKKSRALLVGIWVHKLIDEYHKEKWVSWDDHEIPNDIRPEIREIVELYMLNNRGFEILYSEVKFSFRINGYEVEGTIDLIYRNDEGMTVLRDIKTDSTEPSPGFLARDIQFSIYYLGAIRGLDIKPDMLEWYHVRNLVPYKRATTKKGVKFNAGDIRGNPTFPVSRTLEDIPNIEREIRYIIQGIRFRIFPMRPLKIGYMCPCNMCDAVEYCSPHGAVIPQSIETEGLQGFQQYF